MSSDDLGAAPEGSAEPETEVNEQSPITAPNDMSVSLRAFDTEENARSFGNLIAAYARELSRHINLES